MPVFSKIFTILLFLFFNTPTNVNSNTLYSTDKIIYSLSTELIDVVIPCAKKDLPTLELCIKSIRDNGKNIRRIIVISPELFTNSAEWFDERNFPFTAANIALQIFHNDQKNAERFCTHSHDQLNQIYQKLLKLYAPLVIPAISSNVLVLDPNTIFLNPVYFMNDCADPFFNTSTDYERSTLLHASRVLFGLCGTTTYSPVTHYILLQKNVILDLFDMIHYQHHKDPWKALCSSIDQHEILHNPLSEYTIYFNFIFYRSNQPKIRPLKWKNIHSLKHLKDCKKKGYAYVFYYQN